MDKSKLSEKIAEICLEHYKKLGSRGKPQKNIEWTHMASICAVINDSVATVVSMATGTKCLGSSEVSNQGFSVNDSHAEVLCRRAFIRFLYNEIEKLAKGDSSEYFTLTTGLNGGRTVVEPISTVAWHLFLTHTPCGDASIFPKDNDIGECSDDEPAKKRFKVDKDIYRTGAKCVGSGPQDAKLPGTEYHSLGAFRTKPGRGDRTLSMSCSDKLTKWCAMGLQGCLASAFINRLTLSSVVVGGCPFSKDAFTRAIIERNKDAIDFHSPEINQVPLIFSDGPADGSKKRVCSISFLWHLGMEKVETLVDGYKQGVKKDHRNSHIGSSIVCRRNLFAKFLHIKNLLDVSTTVDKSYVSYYEFKASITNYTTEWSALRQHYRHWIQDERKIRAQHFQL